MPIYRDLMTQLLRVKARWSGFTGAPGYTVLHFRDFATEGGGGSDFDAAAATGAVDRTRSFFGGLAALLPDSVTVTPEQEVDVIEDTTGELVTSLASTSGGSVEGSASGGYSAASGAVVNWRTGGIRNGRRIRGRTFIVPVASSCYNDSGVLIPTVQQTIQTAASQLAASAGTPDLFVYARPSGPGASDGTSSAVTSATVPSMGAILRSRRD